MRTACKKGDKSFSSLSSFAHHSLFFYIITYILTTFGISGHAFHKQIFFSYINFSCNLFFPIHSHIVKKFHSCRILNFMPAILTIFPFHTFIIAIRSHFTRSFSLRDKYISTYIIHHSTEKGTLSFLLSCWYFKQFLSSNGLFEFKFLSYLLLVAMFYIGE